MNREKLEHKDFIDSKNEWKSYFTTGYLIKFESLDSPHSYHYFGNQYLEIFRKFMK